MYKNSPIVKYPTFIIFALFSTLFSQSLQQVKDLQSEYDKLKRQNQSVVQPGANNLINELDFAPARTDLIPNIPIDTEIKEKGSYFFGHDFFSKETQFLFGKIFLRLQITYWAQGMSLL